jgi:hypothetical protein
VETGNGGINALVTRELSTNNYEEKPADKVEPKFNAGDWITNGDYIWKIIDVKPLDYILQSQGGNIVDDTISHVDEQFNLWTIQDAKDGDVLVCPLPKGYEEQIFIFKGINSRDYVENCIEYYCRVCEGEFYENKTGYMGTTSSPVYPATKEQRDTLFAKIKEAGYVWDEEMKELNKIEQKSAWSDEDEAMLVSIISDFAAAHKSSIGQDKWLKSLKTRVQPKQELSEEDEDLLFWTINNLTELKNRYGKNYGKSGKCIDWLKSLKQRIGG